MKNFKIRCSAIGKLMTGHIGLTDKQEEKLLEYKQREQGVFKGNPKLTLTQKMIPDYQRLKDLKNNPTLPKTVTTYLQDVKKGWLYGQKKEFSTVQTDKGNLMEDDAIDFIVEHLDIDWMALKNEKHFEDEFMKGTPDVILQDEIIDIKCSWDCFTFPLFEDEVNQDYWWQGQGYMHLVGKKKYRVAYCLMDMPQDILSRLLNMERWKISNSHKLDEEIYDALKEKYTYSNLPLELRLKVYEFEYDFEAIKQVQKRVSLSRNYLVDLDKRKELNFLLEQQGQALIQ